LNIIYFLKKELLLLRNSEFFHKVSLLATGSLVAQIIVISSSPIITRIFPPSALGVSAFFLSIVGPLSIISIMSYPLAIVLPKNDKRAKLLIVLSLFLAIIFSVAYVLLYMSYEREILKFLKAEEIKSYMYLIPIAIVGSAFSSVVSQWMVRKKLFLIISKIAIITAVLTVMLKIVIGSLYPSPLVLIYISILGLFLSTILFFYYEQTGFSGFYTDKVTYKFFLKLLATAKIFKDFCIYRTPQNVVNIINHSVPILLLSILFGMSNSGYYSLSFAVLSVPITVISGSIYQVIYPKINSLYKRNIDIFPILYKSMLWLAVSGVIPLVVIMWFGQEIFSFIFGYEWMKAGIYAQWMSIALFFYYICRPAIAAIPVIGIQKELLVWEVFDFVIKLCVFYGVYLYTANDVYMIASFSIVSALNTFGLILYVLKKSKSIQVKS